MIVKSIEDWSVQNDNSGHHVCCLRAVQRFMVGNCSPKSLDGEYIYFLAGTHRPQFTVRYTGILFHYRWWHWWSWCFDFTSYSGSSSSSWSSCYCCRKGEEFASGNYRRYVHGSLEDWHHWCWKQKKRKESQWSEVRDCVGIGQTCVLYHRCWAVIDKCITFLVALYAFVVCVSCKVISASWVCMLKKQCVTGAYPGFDVWGCWSMREQN